MTLTLALTYELGGNTHPSWCCIIVVINLSHVMRKSVLSYANNKGGDQPAHSRSLISTFVVHCLINSIISILAISKISRSWLVPVAEQAGLSRTWSQTPKTGFLVTWLV